MNLNNFEEHIEEKILLRGLAYFENDYLEEIEQLEDYEYCGIAIGTEEYSVFIKLDEYQEILDHSCDCPYDWGLYCKHEVAVLYYLKNNNLKISNTGKGKINIIKINLEKMNKEELIEIIIDLSKRNKIIKEEFYWWLGNE